VHSDGIVQIAVDVVRADPVDGGESSG